MKTWNKFISLVLILMLISGPLGMYPQAAAIEKKFSIIVADKNGVYSYYDLAENGTQAGIEMSYKGYVMIPLERITKLTDSLKYSYNGKTGQATITNLLNKKRLVFTKNSTYCTYYAKPNSKGSKKKMPCKMYISKIGAEVMVHISSLKWVMDSGNSVKSFGTQDMMKAGFDTYSYTGLIALNPFDEINSIPKATKVKNLSSTIKVTIPEGYTVPQIFTLLSKKGVCASEEFLYKAMEEYDFSSYSLVKEIDREKNKCYYLEGYLYPDTYEFYRLSSGTNVIGKLLANTEAKTTDAYKAKAAELSLSWEEVLIIASLVEKEAGKKEFMADVSSVIHNRLKIGMRLQLDASIYYVERYIKPYLSEDINRYNTDYNTYKCPALPAGPICNPGKSAIEAALNPSVTDFLFFYSDENGRYYFSKELVKESP